MAKVRPNGSSFQILSIFCRGAPKMRNFRDHWRKSPKYISPGQNFENLTHLKRIEPMFWSHAGQKDWFVIFGRGAPKMSKKSWRETTGVKVRSKILSSGQNCLFWPSGTMCQRGTLQSAECHSCTLVAECHPGTSDSLRKFTPVVRKVSSQDFLSILGASQPKITNRSFWPSCDQTVLLTGVRPKSTFALFDRCVTRKGLKNPRLMTG